MESVYDLLKFKKVDLDQILQAELDRGYFLAKRLDGSLEQVFFKGEAPSALPQSLCCSSICKRKSNPVNK